MSNWDELSLRDKAEFIKVGVRNGLTSISDIKKAYEEMDFEEPKEQLTPGQAGMIKARMAIDSHFGNKTARRLTNYDTRSFVFPEEEIPADPMYGPARGNVYMGSWGNYVIPGIKENDQGYLYLEKDIYARPEQNIRFENWQDAKVFGEHYKKFAPMMYLYDDNPLMYNTVNGGKEVNKFDEGGEKDVTNNLNLLDKALLGISSTIMELGRTGNIRFKTKGSRGAAQDTYLLPRNLQKKVFLDAEYIEGNPGDYGLVKKAVGNRNIPVYQTAPDAVSREDLIVLANPKQSEYSNYPIYNELYHAGSYPSTLYMDTNYNIYRKSWDLNDYGGGHGTASRYKGFRKLQSDLIDFIGSPVVVTTGFQPVRERFNNDYHVNLIDLFKRKDPHAMKYIEQQKLYPLYEDIPIYYNNEPVLKQDGSPMTYTDVTMFSNAPEIIVTPKGNYVYNSYDNVVNKLGGGGFWDTIVNWFSDNKSNNNSNTTQNKADKFTRVLPNDSPTKERSERLENIVAQTQKALYDRAVNKGHDSDPYYIPYVGEELRIPNVGRVSSNTLDSIAVNAERAGIPLSDALGLASVETKFGASPNMSLKAFTDAYPNATEDQKKAYERAVLNSSYMRNYGGIHPQFLVNDHEWANRGWEESAKYKKQLQGITSPLEHAFTLYKLGLYNTGSKKHTSEVKKEGARLMNTPVVQQWNKQRKNKNNVKN